MTENNSSKIGEKDPQPIRNTPEAPGIPSKLTNQSYNLTRTLSRSQITSNNDEMMNHTMNRTMNFQIRKLVPKPIKSTRNDAKFCRQVQSNIIEFLPLSKSHFDPNITKVNYGSNFSIFQTSTFPTFAETPQITLRTSKSESGRAPKSKITV